MPAAGAPEYLPTTVLVENKHSNQQSLPPQTTPGLSLEVRTSNEVELCVQTQAVHAFLTPSAAH